MSADMRIASVCVNKTALLETLIRNVLHVNLKHNYNFNIRSLCSLLCSMIISNPRASVTEALCSHKSSIKHDPLSENLRQTRQHIYIPIHTKTSWFTFVTKDKPN
jgi:hypothetical protein